MGNKIMRWNKRLEPVLRYMRRYPGKYGQFYERMEKIIARKDTSWAAIKDIEMMEKLDKLLPDGARVREQFELSWKGMASARKFEEDRCARKKKNVKITIHQERALYCMSRWGSIHWFKVGHSSGRVWEGIPTSGAWSMRFATIKNYGRKSGVCDEFPVFVDSTIFFLVAHGLAEVVSNSWLMESKHPREVIITPKGKKVLEFIDPDGGCEEWYLSKWG